MNGNTAASKKKTINENHTLSILSKMAFLVNSNEFLMTLCVEYYVSNRKFIAIKEKKAAIQWVRALAKIRFYLSNPSTQSWFGAWFMEPSVLFSFLSLAASNCSPEHWHIQQMTRYISRKKAIIFILLAPL